MSQITLISINHPGVSLFMQNDFCSRNKPKPLPVLPQLANVPLSDLQVERLINKLDTNKDGHLDYR